jgi:tetratricopeptide (TPR) repeat protein
MALERARQDYTRGNYRAALADAEAVVRSSASAPLRAPALVIAGDSAFVLGDYMRASANYTAFLSSYRTLPDAPRVAMARGWAKLRQGDVEHARSTWSAFADEFPGDTRAPLALILSASAASAAGDPAAAQAALDRLVGSYPASPYVGVAKLQRSLLALDRGDENAVVRDLGDVIRTHGSAAVRDHLAIVSALATPGAELGVQPPSPSAPARETVERFADAVIAMRPPKTTAAPSQAATARVLHGAILVAAKERGWANAFVDSLANRLFDEFPSYTAGPTLLARVASAAATAGNSPMAMRDYEKAVARYGDAPEATYARLELAEALVHAGALPQAREQLRRAAVGGDRSGHAWLRLAEVSQMMGDRREALAAYERVPSTLPRTPESLMAHARLLQESGQAASARPLLQTVVRTSKGATTSEAAYDLGRLARERGQQAEALEWFTTAANAAPDSRWGRLAMLDTGDALAALGRRSDAVAAYTKLLAAVPVDAWGGATAHTAERELAGEAAYRGGELLRSAGRHGEALNMFMTSAFFTKGSPTEGRALAGAVRCFIATGDRTAAEALYRELQATGAQEAVVAEARRALDAAAAPSALPRGTR